MRTDSRHSEAVGCEWGQIIDLKTIFSHILFFNKTNWHVKETLT